MELGDGFAYRAFGMGFYDKLELQNIIWGVGLGDTILWELFERALIVDILQAAGMGD